MSEQEIARAGLDADDLIRTEVAVQDRMWGDANERADSRNSQLLHAGLSQLVLTRLLVEGVPEDQSLEAAKEFYPKDWDGFRSYGSTVANLVVAAAYLRSEIKRRILIGEDTTRTRRGQPYVSAHPYVSSDEAIAEAKTVPHHSV